LHTAHFLPLAAIVARAHFRLQANYPPNLVAACSFLPPASPGVGIDVAQDGDLQTGLKTSVDWCVSIPAVGKGPGWEVPSPGQENGGQDERRYDRRRLALRGLLRLQIPNDRDKGPEGPLPPGSLPTA